MTKLYNNVHMIVRGTKIPKIKYKLTPSAGWSTVPPLTETDELCICIPAIVPPVDKDWLNLLYCCLAWSELLKAAVLMFPLTITEPDSIDDIDIEL